MLGLESVLVDIQMQSSRFDVQHVILTKAATRSILENASGSAKTLEETTDAVVLLLVHVITAQDD